MGLVLHHLCLGHSSSLLLDEKDANAYSDSGQASDEGASDRAFRGTKAGFAGFWCWCLTCGDTCGDGGRWIVADGRADGNEIRCGRLLAL